MIHIHCVWLVDHINVEDTIRITQEFVDLLVDESEGMIDDGHHDHEEDLAKEHDVNAHHVRYEVNPEDQV